MSVQQLDFSVQSYCIRTHALDTYWIRIYYTPLESISPYPRNIIIILQRLRSIKLFLFSWKSKDQCTYVFGKQCETLKKKKNNSVFYIFLTSPNCLKAKNANEMPSRFMDAFPLWVSARTHVYTRPYSNIMPPR